MAIRCVVVTPERTELDREVAFVTLPMYDGELGIGLHHSAMIGRLGYGVLRLQTATGTERLFIDGGFAQVEANVVSVLTGRALPLDQLDAAEAEQALEAAIALPGNTEDQRSLRETSILRARGMRRAARR